jgi:hypothetical protein
VVPRIGRPRSVEIVRKDAWLPEPLEARLRAWTPRSGLGVLVREALRHLPPELAGELLDRVAGCLVIESSLELVWVHLDERRGVRVLRNLGVVSRKVVTTAGVNFIVDAFQNLAELENFKFHALGTGTNAEAVGDTALQTELTTQYSPDNTRATGTTVEGASANIYRTVGTNTLDGSAAVTEHGILSQAATGGGTLLDRSVFGALNLVSGDSVSSTFELTCSAGG